jgi:hypothetical protein
MLFDCDPYIDLYVPCMPKLRQTYPYVRNLLQFIRVMETEYSVKLSVIDKYKGRVLLTDILLL